MKRTQLFARLCGVALSMALASPALAQDDEPFQGFHVEGLIGYDNVSSGADGTDVSADGLQYGVGIGNDWQFGRAVVGFGSEYSGATTELRDPLLDSENVDLRPGGDFYIGARLGYVVAPRTMIYAKGGYASTQLKFRLDDEEIEFDDRPTVDGFRVGVGIEQKFGPGMFAKAEYRYSNYSNITVTDFDDTETVFDIDVDRSQFVFGLGYRF